MTKFGPRVDTGCHSAYIGRDEADSYGSMPELGRGVSSDGYTRVGGEADVSAVLPPLRQNGEREAVQEGREEAEARSHLVSATDCFRCAMDSSDEDAQQIHNVNLCSGKILTCPYHLEDSLAIRDGFNAAMDETGSLRQRAVVVEPDPED